MDTASSLPSDNKSRAVHVLGRLSYGPRPGDIDKVLAAGLDRYVEQQLSPNTITLSQSLQQQLAQLNTLRADPVELFLEYGPMNRRGRLPSPDEIKAARERSRVIMVQAVQARFLRAIESPHQLEEMLVDFWYNHFNVFAGKGLDHLWAASYEEQAIRPHVLGRFRNLLEATARHPAMLFYLDNWQNTAPDSPGARGKFNGLNENYARELLELHTLGVDGGYTQNDVIALARILTGWGLRRGGGNGRRNQGDRSGFYFDVNRHDFGDKVLLGHAIRGRGLAEVEEALDILAAHPSTARHISYQLAQFFVADDPNPELVKQLAAGFIQTRGDIRAVLRILFRSPAFWDDKNAGNKFKTPFQYVVSSVRAADVAVRNVLPLFGSMRQLGQPLYGCQTPDGYKNTQTTWLNPDAMMRRISFATALGSGRLPLDQSMALGNFDRPARSALGAKWKALANATPVDATRLVSTLDGLLRDKTMKVATEAPVFLKAGLILGSPEFMYR
jgi:uncharacterized protein (DUF1800 family)